MPVKLLPIKADLSFLFAIKLQNQKRKKKNKIKKAGSIFMVQGFRARMALLAHCPHSSRDLDKGVGSLEVICSKAIYMCSDVLSGVDRITEEP